MPRPTTIYYVLSSVAYNVLIFMKEYGVPIKYVDIGYKCKINRKNLAYCVKQLSKYNLIMKVNPQYFRINSHKQYKITPIGELLLRGFEETLLEYHEIHKNKDQLFTFNN